MVTDDVAELERASAARGWAWCSPPGWATAIVHIAEANLFEQPTAERVIGEYSRLSTILLEELPASPERTQIEMALGQTAAAAVARLNRSMTP